MKQICFAGRSLQDLRMFSEDAMREAGYQLDRVQRGLQPVDWKPMSSIGPGVREIRIKDNQGIYRVIYVTKYSNTVFVLHAFKKKSQKTTRKDLDVAKRILQQMIQESR